jgi:hypothetical protein
MAAIVGLVVGNATYAVIGRADCGYTAIICKDNWW